MTSSQFNAKYKDYLETGHYGLDIDVPSVVEYLDGEFQELIKIPGFRYTQIKMKFSWCCFYFKTDNGLEDKLRVRIENEILRLVNEDDKTKNEIISPS